MAVIVVILLMVHLWPSILKAFYLWDATILGLLVHFIENNLME